MMHQSKIITPIYLIMEDGQLNILTSEMLMYIFLWRGVPGITIAVLK